MSVSRGVQDVQNGKYLVVSLLIEQSLWLFLVERIGKRLRRLSRGDSFLPREWYTLVYTAESVAVSADLRLAGLV